jgi:hypothetical protein
MPLSDKEKQDILDKIAKEGFTTWPKTDREDVPYGPFPMQWEVCNPPHSHELDICLVYGGGRSGKCFRKGTKVLMFDGNIKTVESILPDELVMGPDSKPRKVGELCRGRETMYKVTPNKGEPFYCNESHILSLALSCKSAVMAARFKGEEKRTTRRYKENIVNISIKDYIDWPRHKKRAYTLYKSGPVDFPLGGTLPLDPYMLGAWLGDGSSDSFAVTTMDEEIRSHFEKYTLSRGWMFKCRGARGKAKTYAATTGNTGGRIKDTPTTMLRSLNLLNNKHIPHDFKTASREDRLQLLAGLLDTDGYLSKNKNFEITQKNKTLAEDIYFLANSLGFSPTIKEVRKYCWYKGEKREGTYYRLLVRGPIAEIPVKLERKKTDHLKARVDSRNVGFTLEKLEEEPYYGFSIKEGPDSLFLLHDFFVVHNSQAAIVAGVEYMFKYPGIDIMIGCEKYNHLERTTLNDYRKMFSVYQDFDHPLVTKKVNKQNKFMRITNKSTAWFMHFKEFEVLRGANLGFAHIEEASLITDSAVLGEILRRMSSTLTKQKQILITTNPEESHNWIYETFDLEKFEPGYEGPPPIKCGTNMPYPNREYWLEKGYDLSESYSYYVGKKCKCHLCQDCLNQERGEFLYEDGKCPQCKSKKQVACPGDQYFTRVILTDPKDNPHLSQSYRQTQKAVTSDREFDLYTKGQVIELKTGKCYERFSRKNVYKEDKPLDYDKPMYWNFDFNVSYQCSVVCQEYEKDGLTYADQLSELVLPEAGPAEVAVAWLKKFYNFNDTVYMVFDPAAFNRSVTADDGSIRVKMIKDRLENPEKYRFDLEKDPGKINPFYPECLPKKVILLTRKEEKNTKVLQSSRVDSVNDMCDNGTGTRRFMVNPSCVWTIKSLENIKWKEEGGRPVIDPAPDKLAAKAANKTIIRPLTHPTDALGYYIYKRFPTVQRKYAEMYAYAPGHPLIKTTEDGQGVEEVAEATRDKRCPQCKDIFDEETKYCPHDHTKLMYKDEYDKISYSDLELAQTPEGFSLIDYFNITGSLDSQEDNPFSSFW